MRGVPVSSGRGIPPHAGKWRRTIWLVLPMLTLVSCSTLQEIISGRNAGDVSLYKVETVAVEKGIASWYDDHRTASGERFNVHAMTAAHKKLPFGTKVRVVDLKTDKSIIVRINDRGPYIRGRIIDLTIGAARALGIYHRGIAKVRIEVLKEIPLLKAPNLHAKASVEKKPDREQLVMAGGVSKRSLRSGATTVR